VAVVNISAQEFAVTHRMIRILPFCAGALAVACSSMQSAELQAVPTYENCSIYLHGSQMPADRLAVRYRSSDSDIWISGHPLVVSSGDDTPRGSLFGLRAGSAYEVQCVEQSGAVVASAAFRTWSESVPIARTIRLDDLDSKGGPVLIDQGGTSDGWIRYIASPGFVTEGGNSDTEAILLQNVGFVMLEGLTVRGGARHGIRLLNSHDIRISNCDIAGFGRVGVQDLAKDGKYYDAKGGAINYDAGIYIDGSGRLTIERNWIHDPRNHANSWFFSHPAGPTAIWAKSTGETVVRWNDLVGSDTHRWNDVMEGYGNGKVEGAYNRDSDIYGNYLAFSNDDGIELDGGQCNVRFYGNMIQGVMCGISTAPNLRGPSWVYGNVVANLADERGLGSAAVKNGGGSTHSKGATYFYHNTFASQGSGISAVGFGSDKDRGLFRAVSRNNILALTSCGIQDRINPPGNDFDCDLFALPWNQPGMMDVAGAAEAHGLFVGAGMVDPARGDYRPAASSPATGAAVPIPGFAFMQHDIGALAADGSRPVPWRPEALQALPAELHFHGQLDQALLQPLEVRVQSATAQDFVIRQNTACDWLRVEPAAGSLQAGVPMVLRVSLTRQVMTHGGSVPGAFLVRLASGASVPVTVQADVATVQVDVAVEAESLPGAQDFTATEAADASGGRYLAFVGASKELGDKGVDVAFDLPEDGSYAIAFRVRCPLPVPMHDSMYVGFDGAKPEQCPVSGGPSWLWVNRTGRNGVRVPLTAGHHVMRLVPREAIDLDAVRITAIPIPLYERGAVLQAMVPPAQ
jgi:hypothetical protein